MNILMLSSSYPKFRGDVTAPFIESIATHLASHGHSVHMLLPEHRELRRAALEDGVHIHTYRYTLGGEPTNWGYAESLQADVKLKKSVYLHAPFVFASATRALLDLTAREQFDVVHAHWVLPNAPMAALAAGRRRLPLVISLHGSDVFLAARTRPLGALARWCFGRAAGISACSENLMAEALRLGAQKQKTQVIPYGGDVKAFQVSSGAASQVRAELGLGPSDDVVLGVGRLVYKKGFEFLIRAFADVAATAPQTRLVIAGDGDLKGALEREVDSLGLGSRVIFTGSVSRERIAALYASADIVAVPSVRDEAGNVDGLPNVALEAMAAGKPLVASRVAGLPQVVSQGVNGLLVDEKNPGQLAEAILTLVCDPSLRQKFGAASRVQIREVLNWDNAASRFVTMYKKAVGEKEGTHPSPRIPDRNSP